MIGDRHGKAARRDDMTDLLETVEDGIATLTLNRPERLNALSPAMTAALYETLQRYATDREVGAIVITGAGRGWCAGGDVKTMESRGKDQTVEDRTEGLRRARPPPHSMRGLARGVYAQIDQPRPGVIDADKAGELGRVNRVVGDDELRAETMALARRIADGPLVALGYMKRNLLAAETEDFQTVLDFEAAHQAHCAFTEDHKEAVAAFVEKRRPVFKGR